MGLLQDDKVVYYHPLDSLTDSDSNSWSDYNSGVFSDTASIVGSGKIGNRLQVSTSGTQGGIYSTAYNGLSGTDTRFTVAFWALHHSAAQWAIIGFTDYDNPGGNNYGYQMFFLTEMSNDPKVRLWRGNTGGGYMDWAGLTGLDPSAGWAFYVLDAERSGNNYTLRWSKNGSAFTTESTKAGGGVWEEGTNVEATIAGNNVNDLDEVAVWINADLFTSTELENLYDLGNTFGLGMDQYEEQYSAPICWQATATVNGKPWSDSGSGSCPSLIRVPRGAKNVVVTDNGKKVSPRIVEG
jgi:hypothetical protein